MQHCHITDVSPLAMLQQLHNLNLAGNEVQEVARIQGLVGSLPLLQTLDVRDNPLCKARSYRQVSAALCLLVFGHMLHIQREVPM